MTSPTRPTPPSTGQPRPTPGRPRDEIAAHSPFGRMAPSWTYTAYPFPNGHAIVALAAGFTSAVFVSMPGGLLMLPGLLLLAFALWAGQVGRRRAALHPGLGGHRAATLGMGAAIAGPILAAMWISIGVW